jgi:hypothetical protein
MLRILRPAAAFPRLSLRASTQLPPPSAGSRQWRALSAVVDSHKERKAQSAQPSQTPAEAPPTQSKRHWLPKWMLKEAIVAPPGFNR